jgi:hypothetical protein
MNKREATLAFIEAYKSLPELWDTIVTRTRIHTELTKKTDKPDGKFRGAAIL